ncbi:MAG: NUDIX domain-containing protein, partial [Bdellovibrionales bacterium]|nr:NUDIX domain-containing protein [Bdellovibrionales bacterium]
MLSEGKLFLARRLGGDMHGYWELPGGKVEEGEVPKESLQRELREELGIDVEVGDLVGRSEH